MKKLPNYFIIEANHVSFKSRQKNSLRRFFVSDKMLYPFLTQEPISYFYYQAMQRACTHIRLCLQLKSGNNIYFFLFPELQAFWSLNREKYFALYWCFCVRISLYWSSRVKWIRMCSHRPCNWLGLLTKPTPILSRSICSSHNFVDLSCVNMHSWA